MQAPTDSRIYQYTPLSTRCCGRPNSLGGGCCTVSASLQSIVLRCRVTPPFAELGQMLPVNAIDLGLHLGIPALDQDGEFADQPSERNQSKRISSAGRSAKASASAARASLRGVTRRPPTAWESTQKKHVAPPAEVTGGTTKRFRLTPQRQHEVGMWLKMGGPQTSREWPSFKPGLHYLISEAEFSEMRLHGPKIADDVGRIISEVRRNTAAAAH